MHHARAIFFSAGLLLLAGLGIDARGQSLRGDKLPTGLRHFSGQLVGQLVQKKGALFLVRLEKVLSSDKQSKATGASEAAGKTLWFDVYRNYKKVPEHEKALAGLKVGQKIQIHAAHLKGTRLSVVGSMSVYTEPAKTAGGPNASFFGVTFQTSKEIDPKVLNGFRKRWALAKADAEAGRLAEALQKAKAISADLPKDVEAVGLTRSIEHLQKEMAKQSSGQEKVQKWNRWIAEAVAEENAGRFESALGKIKSILAEGGRSEALSQMSKRLSWKVANGALLKDIQSKIEASRQVQTPEAMTAALEGLVMAKASLPKEVKLPLLDQAMDDLKKRQSVAAFLVKLAERLNEALADEQAGKPKEALEKIAKIRADLPKDVLVDTKPLDEAEARIRKQLKGD